MAFGGTLELEFVPELGPVLELGSEDMKDCELCACATFWLFFWISSS